MRESRLYGLFEKKDGKWIRLHPSLAYRKSTAVKIFQGELLDGFFSGRHVELRPVRQEYPTLNQHAS